MPRPLSFDKNKIIEQTMIVFWQKGYQGTSMRDISRVTGLNPGSLYGSFGNKRALFLLAIEHYYFQLTQGINRSLKVSDKNTDILRNFFQIIVTDNTRSDVRGCLLVNSLLELSHDSEMQAHIAAMFTGFEEMFYWVIVSGQKTGNYSHRLNARNTAQYLINNYFGLRVQCMTEIENEQLSLIIDTFLTIIH